MKDTPKGFQQPWKLSTHLAAVIGDEPRSRPQVTKDLWTYIKANNLQDATNRRMINADEKLTPVFGGRTQVSMFEMSRLLSNHLTVA